jgi:hypothetical protein
VVARPCGFLSGYPAREWTGVIVMRTPALRDGRCGGVVAPDEIRRRIRPVQILPHTCESYLRRHFRRRM